MPKGLTILMVFLCMLCLCAQAEERLSVNTANGALIMDTKGYIFPASRDYAQILPLMEDAFYAGMPKGAHSRYALLDADGNALTAAVYDSLVAQNGSILFQKNHLYGILRTDGTELLGPTAQQIVAADDAYLALGSNPYDDAADELIRILPDGTLLDTPTYVTAGLNPIIENRMRFTDEKGREGFTDANGDIAIPAQYDAVENFEDGLAVVWKNGLCGIINIGGEECLPIQWDAVFRADNAFAALKKGEETTAVAFFDESFVQTAVIEEEKLSLTAVGARFILENGQSRRVCAKDGTVIAELPLENHILAGAGEQLIVRSGAWGEACEDILTADGTLLPCARQHIYPISDTLYVFCTFRTVRYNSALLGEEHLSTDYASMRFGLMDTSAKTVVEAEYTDIAPLSHGYILLQNEESAAIAAADGSILFCIN